MAKNYYETLQLTRDCSDFDILRAYKKLSLRFHPNKTKEDKLVANSLFHEVSEAFEVLSDFKKRSCYDQLGEFGLKNGGPDGKGGYRYLNNAEEIFQSFFKSNEVMKKLLDTEHVEGSLFGSAMRGMNQPEKPRPNDLKVVVRCSLEDLYNGCCKKVDFVRKVLNDDKSTLRDEDSSKVINVRRGMTHGQELRFRFEGDMDLHYPPSDLVFVVEQVKHSKFKRNGKDLLVKIKITLVECIRALPVHISTLDGRTLTISFQEIVSPDTVKVVQDEGMPVDSLQEVKQFGQLEIRFDVVFPKYLSYEKKAKALEILS
jgi:DnaJ-class molecular chaperone